MKSKRYSPFYGYALFPMKTVGIKTILLVGAMVWLGLNPLIGQDHIGTFNIWGAVITDAKLSSRFKLRNELHLRRARGLREWQQQVVRPSVKYLHSKNIALTAGLTVVRNHPYGKRDRPRVLPEHNIWEEVLVTHNIGQVRLRHRNRIEHRWSGIASLSTVDHYTISGYRFSNRLRYRLTADVAFKEGSPWKAVFYNELFVALNQKLWVESLDMRWWYFGVTWQPNKHITYAGGLIYQKAKRNDGTLIETNLTLSVMTIIRIN